MQTYKRKITYFYQFHNGKVGSTTGYLKLEIRGDKVKIIVNIQEPSGMPYKKASLYFYEEAGNHLKATKVDQVESINGVLTYQIRKDWKTFYHMGKDLYAYDGVIVAYNDHHYYLGDFKDRDRSNTNIVFLDITEKKAVDAEVRASDRGIDNKTDMPKNEEFYQCENCPYLEKRKALNGEIDSFEEMIDEYPKLPVYGATELFQCVRIHPRDIGKLDMRNWKLGVNSFLTHGYYTYQYLLLGKMRFTDGMERPIIGVPGVYSNREKYLANMFGFDQFIPVKKTGIKTGEFGYWVIEITAS